MSKIIEVESSLTDRYQTTVPAAVRQALALEKRDKLRFSIQDDGSVVLNRVDRDSENNPVLAQFLTFLGADLSAHPERLQAIDTTLKEKLDELVGDVDVDLESALDDSAR